jgi:2TM domain
MNDQNHPSVTPDSSEYREFIRKRLKKQQEFNRYLGVWSGVSILLLLIWFFTSPGGYFWPLWPILGMGIGAFFQWREAYGPVVKKEITEADIDAEIQRINDQS